jgi:formylmethanofuran dehydrogenase subunit E
VDEKKSDRDDEKELNQPDEKELDQLDERELKFPKNNKKIKPFADVTEFHGHVCPGSALGYRAAEAALTELSSLSSSDEELVAIVENDSCAVDAVQVVTGCTFGKGNLIFRDYGKQVYTFINRNTGDAVRVSLKSSFNMDKIDPNLGVLRRKVKSGQASPQEKAELEKLVREVSQKVLDYPLEDLFEVEPVEIEIPSKAKIFKSLECPECGEMVSEHRVKNLDGKYICIDCFKSLKKEFI